MCVSISPVVSVIDDVPVLKIHAVDDRRVAGELRVDDWDEPFFGSVSISECEVRPEYRRQGVGRKMLRTLIRAARRRRNIDKIFVMVRKRNAVATRAYKSAGFRIFRPRQDDCCVRPDRDYRLMVLKLREVDPAA